MKQISESDRRGFGVRKFDTPTPEVKGSARRIRYLASCHEADNRESAIFDLFHRDVKHRHFMLRRAGLSVFPLFPGSWSSDDSSCLAAIARQLVGPGSVT